MIGRNTAISNIRIEYSVISFVGVLQRSCSPVNQRRACVYGTPFLNSYPY